MTEKDPAFLFYSEKFITGVQVLSFEDRGKYITLLALMHQKGRMTEETIRFIVGSVSDNLKSKFLVDDNLMWYNERLEKEVSKRKKFMDSRIENGKLGGRPKVETGRLANAKLTKDKNKDIVPDDLEKLNDKDKIKWKGFQDFLNNDASRVLKMTQPFTPTSFIRLLNDLSEEFKDEFKAREKIKELCVKMHNYKPLLSKNVDANTTLRNWHKMDKNRNVNPVIQQAKTNLPYHEEL